MTDAGKAGAYFEAASDLDCLETDILALESLANLLAQSEGLGETGQMAWYGFAALIGAIRAKIGEVGERYTELAKANGKPVATLASKTPAQ